MASTRVFEKNVEEGHAWLKDICFYADLETQDKALIALRVVLHELRDNLTLKNASNLSAEFPILMKGIFFENWSPKSNQTKDKFRKEQETYYFKEYITKKLKDFPDIDPEKSIIAVFKTIGRHIARQEVERMRKVLPPEILTYWFEATTYR